MQNTMENNNQLDTSKEIYTVKEIAEILGISERGAYNFVNTTKDFKVFRIGKVIRISKLSFDNWFNGVITD